MKFSPIPNVLGVVAARYELRLKRQIEFLDHYERFYFPKESYDERATAVNGLDKNTIDARE